MATYIHRNDQQLGPFEDQQVIDQLRSGQFSPDDMGIRQGEAEWKKLSAMFPNAVPTQAPFAAIPPPPVAEPEVAAAPVQYEAVYRGTTMQKIFFGLCLLVAVVGFGAAAFYFYTLWGPTGDLQADLTRFGFRKLAQYLTGAMLVGAFFAFLAFVLTFKRKLIRSNGPRIALRVIFILILLVGIGNLAYGAISYLTYSAPYSSSEKPSESNELLEALEKGTAATAPYEMAVIFLPVGAGLFLFGLSGILMTKKLRTE
ncbi:MAG TPA: DUF4339 domain-containing protein [Aridibacter sp.]|nr:DUF4339 domain-containing protein [Aridibacter sp.]